MTIDYGRPAKRGREIWGALVPFDTTWRLGANAATNIRTDRDLDINGVTVPAGHYSMFLLPTRAGATLIVNKQTGQSGLTYDQSQDLGRVPMTMGKPKALVETLRYALTDQGGGKVELLLEWVFRHITVPITVT